MMIHSTERGGTVRALCIGAALGSVLRAGMTAAVVASMLRGGTRTEAIVAASSWLVTGLLAQPSLLPWLPLVIASVARGGHRHRRVGIVVLATALALLSSFVFYGLSTRWMGLYLGSIGAEGQMTYPADEKTWTATDLVRVATTGERPGAEGTDPRTRTRALLRIGQGLSLVIPWALLVTVAALSFRWTTARAALVLLVAAMADSGARALNGLIAGEASWPMLSFGLTAFATLPVAALLVMLPRGEPNAASTKPPGLGRRAALFGAAMASCLAISVAPLGGRRSVPAAVATPPIGAAAPAVSVNFPDGSILDRRHLEGRVVILTFYADWCLPCRQELIALDRLMDGQSREDVTLLAVNTERPDDDGAATAVSRLGLDVTLGWSPEAAAAFGVSGVPATFILDREGIVRFHHSGWHDGMTSVIEEEIATLMPKR